ncbi:hypothetical protein [Pseudomonas sp. GW456-12-1-14-TSB6]|uniref:hypothetical protein n=1 Tax=unclassified Pseudomonas TaxID=196821 RepID=UPI0011AEE587|nr:hypothetical protein [Pseudomonas sp. GW456-12-1-14-TSB6]
MSTLTMLTAPLPLPTSGITASSIKASPSTSASVAPAPLIQWNNSKTNTALAGILVHLTPNTRPDDKIELLINSINPNGPSTTVHTEILTLQRLNSLLGSKLSRIGVEKNLTLQNGDYALRYLQFNASGVLVSASLSARFRLS